MTGKRDSVIVLMLTMNSAKWLPQVLAPIKAQEKDFSINLVVVDGHSHDNTVSLLRQAFSGCVVEYHGEKNLALLRNVALQSAYKHFPDADYFSFIDSDVVVPDDFFKRCIQLLNTPYSRVGIVGVRFELEREPPKHFVSKFYRDRNDIVREGVYKCEYTTTACSVWKAELSRNVVLDQRLKRAGEDVDFNLQITKQGYTALVDANATPSWHIRHATVLEELHRVKDHGLARACLFYLHFKCFSRRRALKTFFASMWVFMGYFGLFIIPFVGVLGILPFALYFGRHWLKCKNKCRLDYAFFGFLLSVIYFTRFLQGLIQYCVIRK